MHWSSLAGFLIVGLALAACSAGTQLDSSASEHSAAVQATYDAWIADMETGPVGYAKHFADDGRLLPPHGADVVGRAAIENWFREFTSRYQLEIGSFNLERIEVSGDLAYARYVATGFYRPADGSAPVPFDQKYLDVLKRQPDGTWKFMTHMWSAANATPSLWDDWSW